MNNITKIKKIEIKKFRGIENADINFGDRVTLICGKNGTSKSSILGMVAQAFNFRKDYTKNPPEDLSKRFYTLSGEEFKSQFSDHFRLSQKFDIAGSMDIGLKVYDGAERKWLNELSIKLYSYSDRSKSRMVMRGNSTINGASSSRYVTHPVIYLSLSRLMPIAHREKYQKETLEYLENNKNEFIALNKKILLKTNVSEATATTGTISSAAAHGDNYDMESVSAGEDNVGQIVKALLSFKKLKQDYADYHGGILLIDEADAGLFPAAQVSFLDTLERYCKQFDLQVVITTHSPTMIQKIHQLHELDDKNYKVVYLTDTFGSVEVREDYSWSDIYHDLMAKTVMVDADKKLPKVNVYFEDKEAYDFFAAMIRKRNIKRVISSFKNISLGCDEYKKLIGLRIPEFNFNSVIVFDGDVVGMEKNKNVVTLPTEMPPDQLIFEFLYNLPSDDKFWFNKYKFTKPAFLSGAAEEVVDKLSIIEDGEVDLRVKIAEARDGGKFNEGDIRKLFKRFYQHEDMRAITSSNIAGRPFVRWSEFHGEKVIDFSDKFLDSLKYCMIRGFDADDGIVDSYFDFQ